MAVPFQSWRPAKFEADLLADMLSARLGMAKIASFFYIDVRTLRGAGEAVRAWLGGGEGFGAGEAMESGGHGATQRGRFGHPGSSGANLGKEGWWTPERQKHAYDKLRSGGLSDAGAKGLISRWVNVEATGGPGSVNPISGAVGIAQWLGARKAGITSSTSFDDQLAHVLREIEADAWRGWRGWEAFERSEDT